MSAVPEATASVSCPLGATASRFEPAAAVRATASLETSIFMPATTLLLGELLRRASPTAPLIAKRSGVAGAGAGAGVGVGGSGALVFLFLTGLQVERRDLARLA